MYQIGLRKSFIARHFLIGGEWGAENRLHAHAYQVEVRLEGVDLDEHGYLVDLTRVEHAMLLLIGHYSNQVLNELPEFLDLNPSMEHLARFFCLAMIEALRPISFRTITVQLWENSEAWASYHQELSREDRVGYL